MKLSTKALLVCSALLSATAANAGNLTLRFSTLGEGTTMGLQPDIYQTIYLTNAFFDIVINEEEVRQFDQGFFYSSQITNATSTRSGVSAGANGPAPRQYFSGYFTACFDNPSTGFPSAGSVIESTCRSSADASGYGSTNGFFNYTGVVTGLEVIAGGQYSEVPTLVNGVPEPSTWALMLAGFAMTGYAMRRRRVAFA